MSITKEMPRAHWGLVAFCFGVFALLSAAILTSGLMTPEPEMSIGTTIGEIAMDIRNAATGNATKAMTPQDTFDTTWFLMFVTPILAALAAVIGGISLFRHEPAALSKMAIAMGIGAFVMQYAFWLALLICGTVLLISIVSNMGGIFGE